MVIEQAITTARNLMENTEAAYLTTITSQGMPLTRAMLNLRSQTQYPALVDFFHAPENEWQIYFTTNTSSRKVMQLRENANASVFYCQPQAWIGLSLSGQLALVTDEAVKQTLWQPAWTMYYPQGPTDDDYAILRLTPTHAELYHQLDGARWEL
ncbi:MAG TPA: pyridoxamine 5'-phosphate oxidase family protein [Armatimonadota bacterium]|nr:pyridoxamine 5'-phosphate oxidase family protein [Armatimonadota bacterium]